MDNGDKEIILWSVVALCCAKKIKEKKKRKWSKDWLLKRKEKGSYSEIFKELVLESDTDVRNYARMPTDAFYSLLNKIEPIIVKQDTKFRESISAGARLEATLRFLATGEPYSSLQYSTRISKQSLSRIIPETCAAIYSVLKDEYLQMPSTPDEWEAVAKEFEKKWNFPHCIGAVDGKHISIRPPKDSGSYYFNYKGWHSIVLMAVVNANYEFMYVDIGTNGRVSDGGVWNNCTLCHRLENGMIRLPDDKQMPGSHRILPYVYAGDDAFRLTKYLMKPYPFRNQTDQQRIFSYRLSRARRTVENAFGIMSSRFRIFHKAINLEPQKVGKIVLACTVLHNYLRREYPTEYIPQGTIDHENLGEGTTTAGSWRNGDQLLGLQRIGRNTPADAKEIRNEFMNYFNEEGRVPWQQRMCGINQ